MCFFSLVLFRCDREDSFDYAWFVFEASSSYSSRTRSSSLQDLRQDDYTLGYLYYNCLCLVVSMLSLYVALPILLSAPLLVAMKPLTFDTFLAKPLFGYVTRLLSPACSAPLIALLVAGEDEVCSRRELVVIIPQYL